MIHRRLWTAAGIIAAIILAGFVLSVPHTRDIDVVPRSEVATSIPIVSVHDSFKKGVHTISGSLEMPNACATVTAQASLQGDASSASGILLRIVSSTDSGVCLQVPTRVNFQTSVSAPAQLPLTATVNGVAATTTAS